MDLDDAGLLSQGSEQGLQDKRAGVAASKAALQVSPSIAHVLRQAFDAHGSPWGQDIHCPNHPW